MRRLLEAITTTLGNAFPVDPRYAETSDSITLISARDRRLQVAVVAVGGQPERYSVAVALPGPATPVSEHPLEGSEWVEEFELELSEVVGLLGRYQRWGSA